MFKVRMQGQYGMPGDKRLRVIMGEMWRDWGLRQGIMRGYWVRQLTLPLARPAGADYEHLR